MAISLRQGSKTDKFNAGCYRVQSSTYNEICPVIAMAALQAAFPERWTHEASLPLCRDSRRATLMLMVREAARLNGDGEAAGKLATHSFRIGGATALYHTTHDLHYVQRFGRWSTDCFHGYLWESVEKQKGVAQKMVTATDQVIT